MKKYLSEAEMRGILDIALKKQMDADSQVSGKVEINHLQDAARKMGIEERELNSAITHYFSLKKDRRNLLLRFVLAFVLILIIVLGYLWHNSPRTYEKPVRVVLAHKLRGDQNPVKEAVRFSLNQERIYLHITWVDIKKGSYKLEYRWIGPDEQIYFLDKYDLTPDGPNYRSWSYYLPKTSDPEGRWTIEVYLDKMHVGSYGFNMEKSLSKTELLRQSTAKYKGEFKAVYTTKIEDSEASNSVDRIFLGETVNAHITWFNIRGTHMAKWRWLDQSGNTVSAETLQFDPGSASGWKTSSNAKTYMTWDPYTPAKSGNFTTDIYIDNAYVTTLTFSVTEKGKRQKVKNKQGRKS